MLICVKDHLAKIFKAVLEAFASQNENEDEKLPARLRSRLGTVIL